MVEYISALLLLVVALLLIGLRKTYYFYPARELKRQARGGDKEAAMLYRAVAYGASLRLLLWILIGLTVAGSFILLNSVAPALIVFIAVAGLIWYAFAWSPNARITGGGAKAALFLTPLVAKILYYTHPPLDWLARNIEKHRPVTFHTGLFEREDLVELVRNQRRLADSRIPHAELDLVLHALTFGEKTVGSIMVPRREVETVNESDVIGPIMMDELYESNHTRFPVIGSDPEVISGIVTMRALVAARHGGTIRDIERPNVTYVHEEQSLYQALHAFLTTKQHMFVVIDSDERYVGVITIEDVLEQVIGHKIEDDFDGYDDRRAVAKSTILSDKPVHVMKTD
ncbi:MAG TPA: CBS domain-containing protein [Candidatus Saccharimonadales bacterium]|jgi:CBS domain containing-hemolysin-like protein